MRLFAAMSLFWVAVLTPQQSLAEASYVYHERSASDLTEGTSTSSCNGAVAYTSPVTPAAGQTVTIRSKVEFQFYTDQARVYWTRDGSPPIGSMGSASGTTQVATADFACTYTPFADVIDVLEATLPAQQSGSTIQYIVSAWHSGGGDEMFANSGTCQGCSPCVSASCAQVFAYTLSGADAGPALDAANPIDAGPGVDSMTPSDAARPDRTADPDSTTLDTFSLSDAGGDDRAPGPDTAPFDAGPVDRRLLDLATIADAKSPDLSVAADQSAESDSTICVAVCLDETRRIVCGAQGQRTELPCTGMTRCVDGRCESVPVDNPQEEGGGCGCQAQSSHISVLALVSSLILIGRRRRGQTC